MEDWVVADPFALSVSIDHQRQFIFAWSLLGCLPGCISSFTTLFDENRFVDGLWTTINVGMREVYTSSRQNKALPKGKNDEK